MIRKVFLVGALALAMHMPARADSVTDGGGTNLNPIVDQSRAAHAAIQCTLNVTGTATLLSSLWSTAGCAAFPSGSTNGPQAAYLQPTGGTIWYTTSSTNLPTASNGIEIFQNSGWWIEGRLSIAALELISAGGSSVAVNVEVRY